MTLRPPVYVSAFCVMVFSLGNLIALGQDSSSQAWLTQSPKPQWIWAPGDATTGQRIWFRKEITLAGAPASARVYATCDNKMTLWINGVEIGKSPDWPSPLQLDAGKHFKSGTNTIAIAAQNEGGIAALTFKAEITLPDDKKTLKVISDTTWKMTRQEPGDRWQHTGWDDSQWTETVVSLGALGRGPWGVPGFGAGRGGAGQSDQATPADQLDVAEGFAVDLIYNVPRSEQGSWVVLARGPGNSLIACDQGAQGMYQINVSETDDGPKADVQPLAVPNADGKGTLSGAQGLLWAFDSLWFHKNGGSLFRITDSDGDGKLDQSQACPGGTGGGEHGNHAVILSADGKSIYLDGGNHAPLAQVTRSRVPSYQEDLLLPRMWDANGHARGILAPGGWVTQLDPQSLEQQLVCIGFRNQYDIALNRFGDMFTYDADMEWDLGLPWYRPTRICHVVSGGDYGWRSGAEKWPTYYEDSLPPAVEIGPGSPTGVAAGIGAKFPAKYQDAIYALDWTFGTIYAIHPTFHGCSYECTSEVFVAGVALPVTDAVVGADGHLYFTVGGRGTQSGLYRVRYVGDQNTAPVTETLLPEEVVAARAARSKLESFHGVESDEAIDFAWPRLSSEDRFLRAAARVAIESQPIDQWMERALREPDPQARITAAVALARTATRQQQNSLLEGLLELDFDRLTPSQRLGCLRAYALAMTRLGRPSREMADQVIAELNPHLPCDNADVNTELVRVLVYLRSPDIVSKTMQLIENRQTPELPDWSQLASRNERYGNTVQRVLDNPPPAREIYYAMMLRGVRDGWTLAQRRAYFEFLNQAAKASGGSSFAGYLTNIRQEALGNTRDEHRSALADITGEDFNPVPSFKIEAIQGPGHQYTIDQAMRSTSKFREANFERGRSLYFAADCGKCHRFAGLGGNIGPDLTSIPNKFDVHYLVENIVEPSKVISDQYQSSTVLTVDGRSFTGLVSQADDKVVIYPADVNAKPITLDAQDVDEINPSPVSQMPTGLIDRLNPDELRDLLAYLMSGGDPHNKRVYGK